MLLWRAVTGQKIPQPPPQPISLVAALSLSLPLQLGNAALLYKDH